MARESTEATRVTRWTLRGAYPARMGPIKRLLAKLRGRGQDEDVRRQLERENEGLWKKRIPPTPRR
jgi:hypothetical protein